MPAALHLPQPARALPPAERLSTYTRWAGALGRLAQTSPALAVVVYGALIALVAFALRMLLSDGRVVFSVVWAVLFGASMGAFGVWQVRRDLSRDG